MDAPQGRHLGFKELAPDGQGLRGALPTFLEAQADGFEGSCEVGDDSCLRGFLDAVVSGFSASIDG